jgi:hypothetical protein
VLTLPNEPNRGVERYIPSKTYQRVGLLIIILLAMAALFALLDFIPD